MSEIDFNNGLICGMAIKGMGGSNKVNKCECLVIGDVGLDITRIQGIAFETHILVGHITEMEMKKND